MYNFERLYQGKYDCTARMLQRNYYKHCQAFTPLSPYPFNVPINARQNNWSAINKNFTYQIGYKICLLVETRTSSLENITSWSLVKRKKKLKEPNVKRKQINLMFRGIKINLESLAHHLLINRITIFWQNSCKKIIPTLPFYISSLYYYLQPPNRPQFRRRLHWDQISFVITNFYGLQIARTQSVGAKFGEYSGQMGKQFVVRIKQFDHCNQRIVRRCFFLAM